MKKNIILNIELTNKVDEESEIARKIAEDLTKADIVKSVQYRYGNFGRVDKVYSDNSSVEK